MKDERPILSLANGAILSFDEKHWESGGGCSTCGYGSTHTQDFTVRTTRGTWEFSFDSDSEYGISHQFLLQTILPNTAYISAMKVEDFILWLTDEFKEESEATLTVTHSCVKAV